MSIVYTFELNKEATCTYVGRLGKAKLPYEAVVSSLSNFRDMALPVIMMRARACG